MVSYIGTQSVHGNIYAQKSGKCFWPILFFFNLFQVLIYEDLYFLCFKVKYAFGQSSFFLHFFAFYVPMRKHEKHENPDSFSFKNEKIMVQKKDPLNVFGRSIKKKKKKSCRTFWISFIYTSDLFYTVFNFMFYARVFLQKNMCGTYP